MPCVNVGHIGIALEVPEARSATTSTSSKELITLEVTVEGIPTPLKALVDTGASNNFVRKKSVEGLKPFVKAGTNLLVRLATGMVVKTPKRVVRLKLSDGNIESEDDFLVIDLDAKFDLILGIP